MSTGRRIRPLIMDAAELQVRTPIRKADDPLMRESSLPLALIRVA